MSAGQLNNLANQRKGQNAPSVHAQMIASGQNHFFQQNNGQQPGEEEMRNIYNMMDNYPSNKQKSVRGGSRGTLNQNSFTQKI